MADLSFSTIEETQRRTEEWRERTSQKRRLMKKREKEKIRKGAQVPYT